jgi:hypothetical protein
LLLAAVAVTGRHTTMGRTRSDRPRHRGQRQQQGEDDYCPVEKMMPAHALHDYLDKILSIMLRPRRRFVKLAPAPKRYWPGGETRPVGERRKWIRTLIKGGWGNSLMGPYLVILYAEYMPIYLYILIAVISSSYPSGHQILQGIRCNFFYGQRLFWITIRNYSIILV